MQNGGKKGLRSRRRGGGRDGRGGEKGRGRQPISHPNKVRGKGIQYSYTEGHTPCKGKARPLLSTKIQSCKNLSDLDLKEKDHLIDLDLLCAE